MKVKSFKKRAALTSLVVSAALTVSACSSMQSKRTSLDSDNQKYVPVELNGHRSDFRKSAYAGIGFGMSRLDPDTSGADGTDVNERVDGGGQITVGADLMRQLSVELHAADLGSAGLTTQGRITYQMLGVSALVYAGKNRHGFKRRGLTGYGKVGASQMKNSSIGYAPYENVNKASLLLGAGVEYSTKIGLGLRGEVIAFDTDAQFAQLGLIYRFGQPPKKRVENIVQYKPTPVVPPIPAVAVAAPAETVLFNGVIEGVNFHSDSAELTDTAMQILNGVATTLIEHPDVPVAVAAHTDSMGDASYNQNLSERRAAAVVAYLEVRGVELQRMRASAFGESNPIASNKTSDGRFKNRRVELKAVSQAYE